MKKIELEVLANGYVVKFVGGTENEKENVYINTNEFNMLNDIGRFLLGYRIKTERV